MKKTVRVLSALAAVAACFLFAFILRDASHGAALAMFIPLMPMSMGHRLLNRAIKLNDGTWGPGGEELDYPIYDRMRLLNSLGTNERTLFKTAVGSQRETVTLTYADTNIEKSESVPSSQKWELHLLRINYQAMEPRTDAEVQLIQDYFRQTWLTVIVNSKDAMLRLPLWKFLGPWQVVEQPAATINTKAIQAFMVGEKPLEIPIVLESLTDWEVRITPLAASAAGLDNDFVGFEFESKRYRKN